MSLGTREAGKVRVGTAQEVLGEGEDPDLVLLLTLIITEIY